MEISSTARSLGALQQSNALFGAIQHHVFRLINRFSALDSDSCLVDYEANVLDELRPDTLQGLFIMELPIMSVSEGNMSAFPQDLRGLFTAKTARMSYPMMAGFNL